MLQRLLADSSHIGHHGNINVQWANRYVTMQFHVCSWNDESIKGFAIQLIDIYADVCGLMIDSFTMTYEKSCTFTTNFPITFTYISHKKALLKAILLTVLLISFFYLYEIWTLTVLHFLVLITYLSTTLEVGSVFFPLEIQSNSKHSIELHLVEILFWIIFQMSNDTNGTHGGRKLTRKIYAICSNWSEWVAWLYTDVACMVEDWKWKRKAGEEHTPPAIQSIFPYDSNECITSSRIFPFFQLKTHIAMALLCHFFHINTHTVRYSDIRYGCSLHIPKKKLQPFLNVIAHY